MSKTRLEAFSDGVIAILITIMVLELETPEGNDWAALRSLAPVLLTYILSFVYLGIYWNNHHHMLHAVDRVNGRALWANLHLLFWLSLVPFTTAWVGHNHSSPVPTAAYGIVFLLAGIAYTILQTALIHHHGANARLREAVGKDRKGKASMVLYALAIAVAFLNQWISDAIYVFVALMWLVPDPRIESTFRAQEIHVHKES
jgi:uncharacterized membrane protein